MVCFGEVTVELLIQHGIDAISSGSLYALLALGIALIFGVMGLINFAHGELIMAGAYAVVLIALPAPAVIPIALATVIALALAMERIAFRPVRQASPGDAPRHLVRAQLPASERRGADLGIAPPDDRLRLRPERFVPDRIDQRSRSSTSSSSARRSRCSSPSRLLLGRTAIGRQMRAAAEDFRMARVLGIRANTVIASAFALSGLLAGVAAILLVAQTGTATPTMGINAVLFAFIATIVGGMGSLHGAVLGGFLLGALTVGLRGVAAARAPGLPRRVRLRGRPRGPGHPASGARAVPDPRNA